MMCNFLVAIYVKPDMSSSHGVVKSIFGLIWFEFNDGQRLLATHPMQYISDVGFPLSKQVLETAQQVGM